MIPSILYTIYRISVRKSRFRLLGLLKVVNHFQIELFRWYTRNIQSDKIQYAKNREICMLLIFVPKNSDQKRDDISLCLNLNSNVNCHSIVESRPYHLQTALIPGLKNWVTKPGYWKQIRIFNAFFPKHYIPKALKIGSQNHLDPARGSAPWTPLPGRCPRTPVI